MGFWSGSDVAELAELTASALDSRGTVYTAEPTTGAITRLVKSDLACRLTAFRQIDTTATPDRGAGLRTYILVWESTWIMPNPAEVVIGGSRWAVVEGTSYPVRAGDTVLQWEAQAVPVAP